MSRLSSCYFNYLFEPGQSTRVLSKPGEKGLYKIKDPSLHIRWLGVGGFELAFAGQRLLIDPYFTRIPLWKQFFQKLQPNIELIQRHAPRADYILVTHAHNDHFLDVPTIALYSGAAVYGSPNTCLLSRLLGVPEPQVHLIEPGVSLDLGPFKVEALPANHLWVPIFTPGPLPRNLQPPLRAVDYRMDIDFSYHIRVDGMRLATEPGDSPVNLPDVDILLVLPYRKFAYYRSLLRERQVKWIIPTHWDDFWRPLSKPILAQRNPPGMAWPPFTRMDLAAWKIKIEQTAPGVKVLLPEIFKDYEFGV